MDPHVVLAMSESALIRLGVATMGDRIRIKQLCKEAVDCSRDSKGVDRDSSGSSTSAVEQVREERRLLFRPYNQSGANHGRSAISGRAGQKRKVPNEHGQDSSFVWRIGTRTGHLQLKNRSFNKLVRGFPQLKEAKGFEIFIGCQIH